MLTRNNYRDREHHSFSSINQFINICSLQYAFQRIYKMPKAFTPVSLIFGSVFHRVMEWVSLARREETVKPQEAAVLFVDLWQRELQDAEDVSLDDDRKSTDYAQQGADLVACAVEHLDPEESVVAVNETFAVPLMAPGGSVSEKPVIGEIDLIVEKEGKKTLVDFKTSARRWPKEQATKSLQPTVYCYAHQNLTGVSAPFRFDVLVKNKTPVHEQHVTERNQDDFDRLAALVRQMEKMVEAEHFLPNEQSHFCSGCPFQEPCKAWHRSQARTISVAA
jgi:CRISPR/Cas system-associated exonuclease Cas4 (RecB family)